MYIYERILEKYEDYASGRVLYNAQGTITNEAFLSKKQPIRVSYLISCFSFLVYYFLSN